MKAARRLQWYWHRARAMDGRELAAQLRKKTVQLVDAFRPPDWGAVALNETRDSPNLPDPKTAPAGLREAVARDAKQIISGRWLAFGSLPLLVDDPPKWHKDYLAGIDLPTHNRAVKLDHRNLPKGADIKLIWELSRWHALVRLAQAAWLGGDDTAGGKCIFWLDDWHSHNPPFRGWNWTSALEAGIRLIQFAWIDALLRERAVAGGFNSELERLRNQLLPAHVWFTWRNRCFGSSANNHLLGELAGLIVAIARWPALEKWSAPLPELRQMLENEILAQFAEDGGNREQALNYHLFSFELCWQASSALEHVGAPISAAAKERLQRATRFYVTTQVASDPWDYGDSDDGFVTPFFLNESHARTEWRSWFDDLSNSPGLNFWLGEIKPSHKNRQSLSTEDTVATKTRASREGLQNAGGWEIFPETGFAMRRQGHWTLRWDLSPLGYLATAAHGHLDALHLSIWFRDAAVVIDPGTGAYYADPTLRAHLANWSAHNGPHAVGFEWPKRLGTFLWSENHPKPRWRFEKNRIEATLELSTVTVSRAITEIGDGWEVQDLVVGSPAEIAVHWQFAPGSSLEQTAIGRFVMRRRDLSLRIEVEGWDSISPEIQATPHCSTSHHLADEMLAGVCSPFFRSVEFSPLLRLGARAQTGINYTTRFFA